MPPSPLPATEDEERCNKAEEFRPVEVRIRGVANKESEESQIEIDNFEIEVNQNEIGDLRSDIEDGEVDGKTTEEEGMDNDVE
jgi:hypothetical protein